MDNQLFDLLNEQHPKFNRRFVEGLAVEELKFAEAHFKHIWKSASSEFPPELEYVDARRCTPEEQYKQMIARLKPRRSGKPTMELAHNDLFLMKVLLRFDGEMLEPVYMYLPYVRRGGLMRIRNSVFSISPVLVDRALSMGRNNLFIHLNRSRVIFDRLTYHFYRDGQLEATSLVYSRLYKIKPNQKRLAARAQVQGEPTLPHYLFARYGLTEAFALFCNTRVKVGLQKNYSVEEYPHDKWVICTTYHNSPNLRPRGHRPRDYMPSQIFVAIPRENYNSKVASLVAGFFYVVDRFPQRVLPDYVDEDNLWRVLLGHLYYGPTPGEGKLDERIVEHLYSLSTHLDNEARRDLQSDGVEVEDFFQLLMHLIETFPTRMAQSAAKQSSMYDKRLSILRYSMSEVINAIHFFMYAVKTPYDGRSLSHKEIKSAIQKYLRMQVVTENSQEHGELSSASAPGDDMFSPITSQLVMQSDSTKRNARARGSASDVSRLLHVSIAEIGAYNTMRKAEPTGRSVGNPYMRIGEDGSVLRDPGKVRLLDSVQRMIQR